MKMIVCAVHDKAVGAFLMPFFMRSRGEAVRSFVEACGDGPFKRSPLDFVLYQIGTFEDSPVNGVSSLEALGAPEALLSAMQAREMRGE